MKALRRTSLPLAAALLLSLAPRAALAAPDPAAAEALYRKGRLAMKQGHLDEACAALAESQKLDPAPGTLLNLASCEEKRGRLATAWEAFVHAKEILPAGDSRVAFAAERAAALEARLPKLTIVLAAGAPADATIRRDGIEVGRGALGVAIPVDPGPHTVSVHVGAATSQREIRLAEGAHEQITIAAPDAAAATPSPPIGPTASPIAPPPAVTTSTAEAPASPPSRTVAYAVLGTGAALAAGGAAFGVLALDRASTVKAACGPDYATCTAESEAAAAEGSRFATYSTVGIGAGALLAGGALVWMMLHPKSSSPAQTAILAGPGAVGLKGAF